jgi:glycine/D-amino acid oxidase-like deaminating enzyme
VLVLPRWRRSGAGHAGLLSCHGICEGSGISTDVIVVGAGVVGASCAYHLARGGLQVTVVENFGGPARGSTGRSFASVRAQWADPLNIELS